MKQDPSCGTAGPQSTTTDDTASSTEDIKLEIDSNPDLHDRPTSVGGGDAADDNSAGAGAESSTEQEEGSVRGSIVMVGGGPPGSPRSPPPPVPPPHTALRLHPHHPGGHLMGHGPLLAAYPGLER